MTVLHIPFTWWPDAPGGAEVYVAGLCRELSVLGIRSVVAAPGEENSHCDWEGIPVWRFAGGPVEDVAGLYGPGDPVAAKEFGRILDAVQPDVVHFHSRTRSAGLLCVQEAKARGLPVVYTYHTPTATCLNGTMMRNGRVPCDGKMILGRCAACALRSRGVPAPVAAVIGHLPPAVGKWLGRRGRQGSAWTALRTSELTSRFHTAVRAFLAEVDHIVAVCEWVKQVLLINGVPEAKITLSRQGVGRGKAEILKAEKLKAEESISEFQHVSILESSSHGVSEPSGASESTAPRDRRTVEKACEENAETLKTETLKDETLGVETLKTEDERNSDFGPEDVNGKGSSVDPDTGLPASGPRSPCDFSAFQHVSFSAFSPAPFRLVFLGRLDETKGVHVVIEALRMAPDLAATLDIYGVSQGAAGEQYRQRLEQLASGDSRIRFFAPVPADSVVPTLAGYDALVVPSQWLETGPLVVLEAFAAGIPVIGSNLGGVAELVADGVNGVLVNPGSLLAWTESIQHAVNLPKRVEMWRSGICPARSMEDVAAETLAVYRRVIH